MTVEKVVFQVNHRSFSSAMEAQLNGCKTWSLKIYYGLRPAAKEAHVSSLKIEDLAHLVAAGLPPGLTAKKGHFKPVQGEVRNEALDGDKAEGLTPLLHHVTVISQSVVVRSHFLSIYLPQI
jgi:hypothetical protein